MNAPTGLLRRNGVEGVFEPGDVVRLVQVLRNMEPRHAA